MYMLPTAVEESELTADQVAGREFPLQVIARPVQQTVAVLGLGYVGLPTALALHRTHCLIGVDISANRLAAIRRGRVDLLPDDQRRLGQALSSHDGAFELTSDERRLSAADAVIICVPTPVDAQLVPDLELLRAACASVVRQARRGQLIVLTSTTYVGATRQLLIEPLRARGLAAGVDVHVAFCPERIDPGNSKHVQSTTPRVAGGATPECAARTAALFAGVAPTVHTVGSVEAAEMTKLMENTFRAVNIALANEFSDICRVFDLDPIEITDAAATKPYGFLAHYPGPGVGGHCIPCDPHYLLWQLRAHRVAAPLVQQAMGQIALRPGRVVSRAVEVLSAAQMGIMGTRILVVGVAYKPDVEDVRESPALEIIRGLHRCGAKVSYYDSLVPRLRISSGEDLDRVASPRGEDYDLVIVHSTHRHEDFGWVGSCPNVLDATYRLDGILHRQLV